MSFLASLLRSGTTTLDEPSQRRGVQLSNQISLALFVLVWVLTILYAEWYGWSFITKALPIVACLCMVPLFLNRIGFTTASRVWLGLLLSVASIVVSINSKMRYYGDVSELDYFGFRYFLLAGCTLPPILFSFTERRVLAATSAVSLVLLIAYDPLHALFGVPYPKLQLSKMAYDFTNIIVVLSSFIIMGAIFFLKRVSEKSEEMNNRLIRELNQTNVELAEKNTEVEAQSSELQAQRDALHESHEKLEIANQLIEEQKNSLFMQNKDLAEELIEKNKVLTETNHELIKHNNELSQFSYTVSHNLRGPVASLLGLIQIMDNQNHKGQQDEINKHLRTSVNKLDSIIRDLSKIIDIRNDIFRIRQPINLSLELDSIRLMLKEAQGSFNVQFQVDLSRAPVFYSVRPMVVSIFYNLISNALKYRSLERPLQIEVTSEKDDNYFILTVRDNGMGIDLVRHGQNIFKMYKRFHHHIEGKGLGLYLIKMQAEALNGRIEVQSQLNAFTEFKVFIGISQNLEEQVLYDESSSKIFYDAVLNSISVVWRGPVSADQFRSTYTKGLEFLKAYNTPNWITDLTHQGPIPEAEQRWLVGEVLTQAIENGLRRVAAIRPFAPTEKVQSYLQRIDNAIQIAGLDFRYFDDVEQARKWIRTENESATVVKTLIHE